MAGLLKGLSARGRDDRALSLATEHRAEAAEEAALQVLDSAAPSTALLACSLPLWWERYSRSSGGSSQWAATWRS
jgi:hypothetical protein